MGRKRQFDLNIEGQLCPHCCRPPHQQAHDPHCFAAKFRSEPFLDVTISSLSEWTVAG